MVRKEIPGGTRKRSPDKRENERCLMDVGATSGMPDSPRLANDQGKAEATTNH